MTSRRAEAENEVQSEAIGRNLAAIRRYVALIGFVSAGMALYFAKQMVLPFILAILLALTLSPVTRALAKYRIPPVATALVLITAVSIAVASGALILSGPVSEWVEDAPRIRSELETRLSSITESIRSVKDASEQVEEIAKTATDPDVVKVAIEQPGIVTTTVLDIASFATTSLVALVLALFLLASGDMFYVKLVEAFPRFGDKKRALKIAYGIEQSISKYLLSITLINAGLGIIVGTGLWLIGMPQAPVWGALAFLLNFLPYIGAAAGVSLCGAVALASFDTLGHALLAPAFYLLATSLEGQFVTPVILGRRLELNAVSVFSTVVFWAWIWGFAGALTAVPFLVCLKVICDHVPALSVLGSFLSSSDIRGRYDPLRSEGT
ncbi:AI-2E family transporter [Defluviimonas sp. WL0050]|uniref:AI-2E family transporter n=1 Tax=Albidovulum litorale TaxID=2984134 RepID=A0ABT2ZNL0_9RHOB|nr:AI-2E family transporter [Defluviimonas sp. WL0050]MCV2872647.1 AI-2E family transporter [Defluviimonas sp. WL0050]